MMNEVNKLIWPSPGGIGLIEDAAWRQTVDIAKSAKNAEGQTVIKDEPDKDAYSNDYVTKAHELLKAQNIDINGSGFTPITVELKEGGA